jgi:hypothetical protein
MQSLIGKHSSGPDGPVYLRFSNEPVADSGPSEEDEDVVIDFAADRSVVGVEVVAIVPETVVALAMVAKRLNLDLSPLFADSLQPTAA